MDEKQQNEEQLKLNPPELNPPELNPPELNPPKLNQEELNKKLSNAAYDNRVQEVEECMKLGANVNWQDCGYTSLHWSCFKACFEILKLLVENGADVNIQNSDGRNFIVLCL